MACVASAQAFTSFLPSFLRLPPTPAPGGTREGGKPLLWLTRVRPLPHAWATNVEQPTDGHVNNCQKNTNNERKG